MATAPLTRRDFLRIAVAGGGLAGSASLETGCERRTEPRIRHAPATSPEASPGVPAEYATVCRECPAGCGMIARHRDGRVTKLEGNPDHPIGGGRLCARGQAAVQGLYDPDRVRTPLVRRPGGTLDPISWDEALALGGERLAGARARGTGRIALVSGLDTGSLAALESSWLEGFGSDRYHPVEPLGYEALRAAMTLAFGLDVVPRFDLTGADYILALGADFLDTGLSPVEQTRRFAALRDPEAPRRARLVVLGPRLTLTAAAADRRAFVRGRDLGVLGMALLKLMLESGRSLDLDRDTVERLGVVLAGVDLNRTVRETGLQPAWLASIAEELAAARAPVVLAGDPLLAGPSEVAAATAALLLNRGLGATGRIRWHGLSRLARPAAVGALGRAIREGEVDLLVLREANPAYAGEPMTGLMPTDDPRPFVIALASALDDSAARADLVFPVHTPLEAWGDGEIEPGVFGLQQPAMGPVHDTRHAGDVLIGLAAAAGNPLAPSLGVEDFRGYLHQRWSARHAARGDLRPFAEFWTDALRRGGVFEPPPSNWLPSPPPLDAARLPAGWNAVRPESAIRAESPDRPEGSGPARAEELEGPEAQVELHLFPTIALYDGRGANRSWLQELADPVTKVTWSTWIEAHPETAGALGLADGDLVRLASPAGTVTAALIIHLDIARGVLAVPIGEGHEAYGRHASGRGANPLKLLGADRGASPAITAERRGRAPSLARIGGPADPGDRLIVPLAGVATEPIQLPLPESYRPSETVVPHEHKDHRWGMVIDVEACTGCSACVTACYAENNIPVVGEQNVREGREMAWITLHRYDVRGESASGAKNGRSGDVTHVFLPMLCQHCDAAPCEPVCPTFAAYHTEEGLNGQVYPRCIGTRYCANNCPYKVRRFNWHAPSFPAPLDWQLNPDVTIRGRGVMEKCTFCVQRITAAKQSAARDNRTLKDGDVVPACAATCPASAIVFGDLLDPHSRVTRLMRHHPRRYQVLGELGTRPAVVYLAKLRRDDAAG